MLRSHQRCVLCTLCPVYGSLPDGQTLQGSRPKSLDLGTGAGAGGRESSRSRGWVDLLWEGGIFSGSSGC